MFEYLAHYRGCKRLVRVENKGDVIEKICEKFNLAVGDFSTRVYLDTFHDVANVSEPSDLPDQGKLFLESLDSQISSLDER